MVFDDTLANPPLNTNINIPSSVSPASVTVNNSIFNYSIGGNPIGGMGSLTKSDTGVLTLGSANTYSGGTTLDGGTLQMAITTPLAPAW